jgi:diketogulonate reductase-like aldo/keto reductase
MEGTTSMEYRKLGSSGMYISELAYGNWVTHGEQIDQDQATACVRQALDLGYHVRHRRRLRLHPRGTHAR